MRIDEIARRAADSVNQIARNHPAPGIEKRKPLWRRRLVVGLAAAAVTLVAIGTVVFLPSPEADKAPLDTTLPVASTIPTPVTTTPPPVTTTLPGTITTVVPEAELPRHLRVTTPDGVVNLPGNEVHPGSGDLSAHCCLSLVDDGNGGVYVAYPIEEDEDGIVYADTPYAITWLPLGEDRVDIFDGPGRVKIHQLVTVEGAPTLVATIIDPNPELEGSEIIGLLDVGSGKVTEVANIGQLETVADKVTYSDGLFVVTQINHSSSSMFTVDLAGNIERRNFPTGEGEVHFAVPYVGGTFSPDGSTIAVVYQEWIQDPNGTAGELRVERADLLLLDREGNELNRWRVFNNDFDNVYDAVVAVDYDGRFVMVAANEWTNPGLDGSFDQPTKSRIYWVDTSSDAQPSSARGWDDIEILDLSIATGREPIPSQSPADAARDGVVAEVAALPFEQRVQEGAIPQPGTATSVETAEGTYLVSRMPFTGSSTLGSCPAGTECLYGRDYIAPSEYGEIVLLREGEITQAWPMPGYPPRGILVTNEAIYCIRQGDGGLPNSHLCRIDRETGEAVIRIFPFEGAGDVFLPEWMPANWTVNDPAPVVFETVDLRDDGSILISGWGGARFVDPETLELRNACGQSEQFGFIKSFDGQSFSYDDAEWLTGEEANQAAIAAGEIEEGDTVPNDYYIRNESETTRTLALAEDAIICMSTTQYGGVSDQVLTVDEFFGEIEDLDRNRWITDPFFNGSWVDQSGGLVTRLVVQYQP